MQLELIAFFVLSVLALTSAVIVIAHRNPIVSALALAFNLVSIAGFYFVLDAQFIGLLQVIVYAGAIMVLILFVLMLLNLRAEVQISKPSGNVQRFLAPLLGLLFVALVARGFLATRGGFPRRVAGYGTVESVGRELYGRFFYPFEVVSLLLVAAMIGAVLLAKRKL